MTSCTDILGTPRAGTVTARPKGPTWSLEAVLCLRDDVALLCLHLNPLARPLSHPRPSS